MNRTTSLTAAALFALLLLPAYSTSDGRVVLASSDVRPFVVDQVHRVAANLAIKNNVRFAPGARVQVESGATLVFQGDVTSEPRQLIFDGPGRVLLRGQRSPVYAEWFGAIAQDAKVDSGLAFTKAASSLQHGGAIQALAGEYYVDCRNKPGISLAGAAAKALKGVDRSATVFRPMAECSSPVLEVNLPGGGDLTNFAIYAKPDPASAVDGVSCVVCSKMTIQNVRTFGLRNPFMLEYFAASNLRFIDAVGHSGSIVLGGSRSPTTVQRASLVQFNEVASFPLVHNGEAVGRCLDIESGANEVSLYRFVGAGGTECVVIKHSSTVPGAQRPGNIRFFAANLDASPGGSFNVYAGTMIEMHDSSIGQTAIPRQRLQPAHAVNIRSANPAVPETVEGVWINSTMVRGAGLSGIYATDVCNVRITNGIFITNSLLAQNRAGIEIGKVCGLVEVVNNLSGVTDTFQAMWANTSGTQDYGLILGPELTDETYTSSGYVDAQKLTRSFVPRIHVVGNMFGGNLRAGILDRSKVSPARKNIAANLLN